MSALNTRTFADTYDLQQEQSKASSGFWRLLATLRPHYWLLALTIGAGLL